MPRTNSQLGQLRRKERCRSWFVPEVYNLRCTLGLPCLERCKAANVHSLSACFSEIDAAIRKRKRAGKTGLNSRLEAIFVVVETTTRSALIPTRGSLKRAIHQVRQAREMRVTFYRADGLIHTSTTELPRVPAYYKDSTGHWRITSYDVTQTQDFACVPLHDAIKKSIMTSQEFEDTHSFVQSPFIYEAGLDPDSKLGKKDFERFLASIGLAGPSLHKCLYWQDFSFLVNNIQSGLSEIVSAAGEFQKLVCEHEFTSLPDEVKVGVRRTDSPTTRLATLLLHTVFVRMHSVLDYAVKLALEVERESVDFNRYPKLIGLNEQYKRKSRLSINGKLGTLFEDCTFIRKVAAIRNRIIHDGHLSPNQWLYERYSDGAIAERFILFPDMQANPGAFDRSGNRSSFYGSETKINLELPGLIEEFMDRTITTMSELIRTLRTKQVW